MQFDEIFRSEYGRIIATLVRFCGDIQLAEEAAQDAFLAALERWPETGLPPNPGGWLTTTARNRVIDRLRRESTRDARQQEAACMIYREPDGPSTAEASAVADDRLRLMFTCCHPALAMDARVALTLKLLGGLSTAEIAAAFLVPETTMAQRLTRAKKKIAANRIPYRVPGDAELPARLAGVLAALYLIFNEGYLSTGPDQPIRHDLSAEAIRLARLVGRLMPDEPEAQGLLALMLLIDARRAARVSADGVLVPLPEQDRSRWDTALVAEGHDLVRACLRRQQPGPYQILAAVNAVHTDAHRMEDTDWRQIVALYDQLLHFAPTPIVRLNRAVAVAELDGPQAGLALVDQLDLDSYHAWQVARADLLRRLHRPAEAAAAYRRAIELSANTAEQAYLSARLSELPA